MAHQYHNSLLQHGIRIHSELFWAFRIRIWLGTFSGSVNSPSHWLPSLCLAILVGGGEGTRSHGQRGRRALGLTSGQLSPIREGCARALRHALLHTLLELLKAVWKVSGRVLTRQDSTGGSAGGDLRLVPWLEPLGRWALSCACTHLLLTPCIPAPAQPSLWSLKTELGISLSCLKPIETPLLAPRIKPHTAPNCLQVVVPPAHLWAIFLISSLSLYPTPTIAAFLRLFPLPGTLPSLPPLLCLSMSYLLSDFSLNVTSSD